MAALNRAKNVLFSRKPVILGVALIFFALTLSCGFVQSIGHTKTTEGIECNQAVQLVNHILTKDELLFGILFFLLVGIAFLVTRAIDNRYNLIADFYLSLIQIKESQILAKVYNQILEALRKGILNPQIYNLAYIIWR